MLVRGRFVINFVLSFLFFSSYLGYLELFLQFTVAQLIEQLTHYLEVVGSSPTPGNIFSIYLNEELNQMENNNKNSSNSLVFGRWPQTKTKINKGSEWPI